MQVYRMNEIRLLHVFRNPFGQLLSRGGCFVPRQHNEYPRIDNKTSGNSSAIFECPHAVNVTFIISALRFCPSKWTLVGPQLPMSSLKDAVRLRNTGPKAHNTFWTDHFGPQSWDFTQPHHKRLNGLIISIMCLTIRANRSYSLCVTHYKHLQSFPVGHWAWMRNNTIAQGQEVSAPGYLPTWYYAIRVEYRNSGHYLMNRSIMEIMWEW